MAVSLSRDNYEIETIESKEPVLVDFWGEQCIPCKALHPVIDEIEKEYEGRLKVAKVNAPENRMLCAKLRVLSMPTFILYKNGTESQRLTGETIKPSEIKEAVKELLA